MKNYAPLLDLFLKHLEDHTRALTGKLPAELYEPEKYILSLGGKRLRPLLALIACDLYDKDPALALDTALAVELFHNFSLIHDDILDNAPIRRNKPTVHEKWNTNIAILSGDVMLVKAFQAVENNEPPVFKQLNVLLNKTAVEVCEGQQMDMNFESSNSVTVSEYITMITFKTAVLLGCSLQMGALKAGASADDQQHLYEFGKHLGISFQLLDDMLDAFADPSKFGKQVGGDIISNKKTFLLLKALELSSDVQRKNIHQCLQEKDTNKKVNCMLSIYRELKVEKICRDEAEKHTSIALQHLQKINAQTAKKDILKQFTSDLLNRQV